MLNSKYLKQTALIIFIGAFVFSCNAPITQKEKSTIDQQESMHQRPIVYQIFTRLFGNANTNEKQWGSLEENGVGKFNQITKKALKEIKALGITHVWYTGAIEHGVLTDYTDFGIPLDDADIVKGRAGSPYAIKDYYDVNPDLAEDVTSRMEEFEALIKRTHKVGMKVVIDFVPNHVARSYSSDAKPEGITDFGSNDDRKLAFSSSNNFYYIPNQPFVIPEEYQSVPELNFPNKDGFFREHPAKATGNDVFSATPSVNDWFETVKLNYGVDYLDNRKTYFDPVPDTWLKMRDILLFWSAKKVDAFRCDMAEMVPVEFWQWVTNEVKAQYPDVVFIAEVYNPNEYRNYIHVGGFDYLYDKVELYDSLKNIIRNHSGTDHLTEVWQKQDGIVDNMLRFLENHDEQRIASPDFAGDMKKGIPMMAATAFMHKGPVMMYFGQEVGEPAKGESGFSGDDGRTTIFDYWHVPEHIKWMNNGAFNGGLLSDEQKELRVQYSEILNACNEMEAFKLGQFYDLHYYNRNQEYQGYSDKVYVFVRHSKDQVILVAINFGDKAEKIAIKIPEVAWRQFGLNADKIKMIRKKNVIIKKSTTFEYDEPSDLKLALEPMSYQMVPLENVK
jgi:glycosidase